MEKWKCTVCGYIHEGNISEDYICPICKTTKFKFVMEEKTRNFKESLRRNKNRTKPTRGFCR